jgi:hypothetical protein
MVQFSIGFILEADYRRSVLEVYPWETFKERYSLTNYRWNSEVEFVFIVKKKGSGVK